MKKAIATLIGGISVLGIIISAATAKDQFVIAIMQDQSGAAQKFRPLIDYMAKKDVDLSFRVTNNYLAAAQLFASGGVDAMFSGSGVAGTLMIKGLAYPQVRPMDRDGHSSYWASIVSRKGVPAFMGKADYFNGKKVIFTALASSGEFYFRSLPGADKSSATVIRTASHGSALEALDKGYADVAIVKNRVWDKKKVNYPNLVLVGEDKGENPDGTLMVSNKSNPAVVAKVTTALLGLKDDASAEAMAVKNGLDIKGYLRTTARDFEHTLTLLRNAGVTKAFELEH